MGTGFGLFIYIYPHSVQAGLIRMKPEAIHYVCSDGAQADTTLLQYVLLWEMFGNHNNKTMRVFKIAQVSHDQNHLNHYNELIM